MTNAQLAQRVRQLEAATRASLVALVGGNTDHSAVRAFDAALPTTNTPEKGEAGGDPVSPDEPSTPPAAPGQE